MIRIRGPILDRIAARTANDDNPFACWVWQGTLNHDGYGRITYQGRSQRVHRLAWTEMRGEIPKGLELDHRCGNRACWNPDHLEPVTHYVNNMRGQTIGAINAMKTHCVNGHAYDKSNTYVDASGSRHCRQCVRDRSARYRGRKAISEVAQP